MATSLYDLSVPTFLQTVRAVAGFLDRAARRCAETGADPDDFVNARLIHDMAPFHFQIEALAHHSVWGLEALKTGVFAPPALIGSQPFADLQTMIAEAVKAFPNFKVAATTLRNAKTASFNDWGAVIYAGGQFYEARLRENLEIYDRVGGGDGFASGLAYGFLEGKGPQAAVEYGAAHGAMAMTTPGDTSMVNLKEVEAIMKGKGARVIR